MSLTQGWINPYLFTVIATGGQTGYTTSNIMGYWDFNTSSSYSGSGTNVSDISGAGTIGNLTISGSGTSYYGSTGAKSLSIPTSGAYLISPSFSHTFASTGMTYEILCYYNTYSQGPFFFNSGGTTGQVAPWTEVYSSGVINVAMGSGGPLSVSGSYTTPAWRHFVFTCTSGGSVAMYVNGVAQGTGSAGTISSSAITLVLGNYWTGSTGFGLNGYLGFARIYNRPLSSAEVITNYNATRTANPTYSLPSVSTPVEYPPSAMSNINTATSSTQTLTTSSTFNTIATTTGTITYGTGSYTIMCSSCQPTNTENMCCLFNKSNGDRWTGGSLNYVGGSYSGSATTTVGTSQNGEWTQIQLPSAITLSSFIIYPYSGDTTRAPLSFVLAGSNNGTTWVSLSDQTAQTSWTFAGAGNTYTTSPGVAYSYYRLIIRAIQSGAGGWMSLGELRLFGV